MSDGWDIVAEYADTVAAMVETENELRREIAQLRGELTLAEEGLASYAQENGQMLQTLREILEELRLDDSRHDLQAKIIATPGFSEPQSDQHK